MENCALKDSISNSKTNNRKVSKSGGIIEINLFSLVKRAFSIEQFNSLDESDDQ